MRPLTAFFLLCAFALPPAMAQIDHERVDKSYTFLASDLQTAGSEMMSTSPVMQNGQRFAAFTWSTWNWRINWHDYGSRCELTDVEIEMTTEMTLPVWGDVRRAPSKAQREWRRFSTALLGHENGHVDINVDTVNDLEQQLLALPPEDDCDALHERAKDVASHLEKKGKQAHLDYDLKTKHGRTQGAWLKSGGDQ